jgi:isopropylmalate/homocitrate/citramalate synthase
MVLFSFYLFLNSFSLPHVYLPSYVYLSLMFLYFLFKKCLTNESSLFQVIAGLARAVPNDIQRAYDAVKHAPLHRIHTFLATSDIHLKHKLRISREECITRASTAVAFAKVCFFISINCYV